MQPFTEAKGRAVVLPQPNIDTDVIIRIDRLMHARTHPEGRRSLGQWAFEALRFGPDGEARPDCPLNDAALRNAPILIAGRNFGCGSSREGAVWALQGAGFRCVIAESFGDIFYANCFQNGMLPIMLPGSDAGLLADVAQAGAELHVDLVDQVIEAPGLARIHFAIDPHRRTGLLGGLDEVGQSLLQAPVIAEWQMRDRTRRPWAWTVEALGAGKAGSQ